MGSDNSNIDLDLTSLKAEKGSGSALENNPVNHFSQRENLQKSLSNFSHTIKIEPSLTSSTGIIPIAIRTVRNQETESKPIEQVNLNQDLDEDDDLPTGSVKISSGVSKFWKSLCKISKNLYHADWSKIGSAGLKVAGNVFNGLAKAVKYAFENPAKCLNLVKSAAAGLVSLAVGVVKGAVNEIQSLLTNPVDTLGRWGGFAKSFCDAIGLTDIVAGTYHGFAAVGCLLTGNLKAASEHALQSTRAVKGAVLALGEFTGITDIGRAVIALAKGDYAQAAFFGAIGAGQIYLVCTTLGLGNILSRSGVEAAREGVRILAKETGQEVVKAVEKKLSNEFLEKTGSRFALDSAKAVLREWDKIAADLFTGCKKIVSQTVETGLEKVLRDAGVKEIVSESTETLLCKIYNTAVKDLAKEFTIHGISLKEANYMAKCLKKALWKQGRKSHYHAMLAEEIIDEISVQLKENLFERGLKKGFEQTWLKSVDRIVKFKGLPSESADLLRRAGKEGFEEGADLAIRKIVREGVEAAFKKFCRMRFDFNDSYRSEQQNWTKRDRLEVDLKNINSGRDNPDKKKRRFKKTNIETIKRDAATGLVIKEEEDIYAKNKYIER